MIDKTKKTAIAMPSPEEWQWLLTTLDIIFAIMALVGGFIFPPLVIPALLGIIATNGGKMALGGKGILSGPNLQKIFNQIRIAVSSAFLGMAIFLPALLPVALTGLAIFTIFSETVSITQEITQLIKNAKKITQTTKNDQKTLIDLKKERNKLIVKSIESGVRIGLAVAVIGLTAGSFFFPPLLLAGAILAGVGGLGLWTYQKFARPKLMKKLDQMVEQSIKLNTTDAKIDSTQKPQPTIAPSPTWKPTINRKASFQASIRLTTAHPIILTNAEPSIEFHETISISTQLKTLDILKKYQLLDLKKGNEGSELRPQTNEIIFYLTNKRRIRIHANSIETNSPEDLTVLQSIAEIAKSIGWEKVYVGLPPAMHDIKKDLPTTELKQKAISIAEKNNLMVIHQDDEGTKNIEGLPELHHH